MKKLLFVLITFTALIACKKESPSYPFRIIVVDEDGNRIQNAYVRATAPIPDAIPDFEGYTGFDGSASFEYSDEAVLQVTAQKGTPPSFEGCAYVKLEADNTVEIYVVMLPYSNGSAGC